MPVALLFPTTDTGLLNWSLNVVNHITPTPSAWGLVTADVTAYTALHNAFGTALEACEPSVRNKPAVVTKNDAKIALKNAAFVIAGKIYASPSVTDAQKVAIGMPPRATPMPIPPPSSQPVIEIISTQAWTARIRLRSAEGGRRGKPAGTAGASVFSYVGPTPPCDINAWRFEGSIGRVTKIDVSFPTTLAAGTKVWLCAFWFNGRKQSGPVCDGVSVNLPGGGVSMMAA